MLLVFSSEKCAILVKKLSLLPWQSLGRYLRYFARVSFISICSHTLSFSQIHVSFHNLPESYIDHYLGFQILHLIAPFSAFDSVQFTEFLTSWPNYVSALCMCFLLV